MITIEPTNRQRLLWMTLFAVAMAQLEAAVVVYLRALYYPEGFGFPLVILGDRIAAIEIGREAATVLMLIAVARLSSHDRWRRWAAFLYLFGLWDLGYYLWLKILLDWPSGWLTWDILFLIPLPWVGPVLSAAAVAAIMVVAGLVIEGLRDRGRQIHVGRVGWALTGLSVLGLLTSYMAGAEAVLAGRVPGPFPWWLWGVSLLPAVTVAVRAAGSARRGEAPRAAETSQPASSAEGNQR